MKCPTCNWNNPPSYSQCFSCHQPLTATLQGPAAQAAAAATVVPPLGAPVHAAFGDRLTATLIDALLMFVPGVMILVFGLGYAFKAGPIEMALTLAVLLSAALAMLLPAVMDALGKGSIGKRIAKIQVVNGDAEKPGLLQSMLRHLFKYCGHFMVPFVLRLLESLLFRGRSLHDVVAQTHVVKRSAGIADIRQAVAGRTEGRVIGIILASILGFILLAALSLIISMLFRSATEMPNPKRDAVRELARAAKPITLLVQNHYLATGAFPADTAALGLDKLPPEIGTVQLEAGSGKLTIVAAQEMIAGKRIVLMPELKSKRDKISFKRWHCGSPDLPKDDLPSSCNDAVAAIAAR